MPEAILGPVAGAVVGGMMSDSGGGGQTASTEPWAAAAPWLKDNLKTGQALQQYYQQNPFNAMQQTGYQNLFSDLDNFRTNMAPGLMQFANQAMNSSYQRPQYSQPGTAGYGQQPSLRDQVLAAYRNTPGAEVNPSEESIEYWMKRGLGGFADEVNKVRQENPQLAARIDSDRQRLYGHQANQAPQGSPFSVAAPQPQQLAGLLNFFRPTPQSYGLLNFQESNPFTATNGIPKAPPVDPNAKTPEQIAMEEAVQRERDRHTNYGGA